MKKFWNWFGENWYLVLGFIYSLVVFYVDCFGKGNKDHAIAWALLVIMYLLLLKSNADRERAKEIKKRLDILAGALLPILCKDNYAINAYKELMKDERITFEEDTWYPCYFKPAGGQLRSHEVLDGLYNPFKRSFKLDPKFKENIEGWNNHLEDYVWYQNDVLEYTLKETK